MRVALGTEGRRQAAEQAQPGGHYFCEGCGTALVLRRGRFVTEHFAHPPGTACATWAPPRPRRPDGTAQPRLFDLPATSEPSAGSQQAGWRRRRLLRRPRSQPTLGFDVDLDATVAAGADTVEDPLAQPVTDAPVTDAPVALRRRWWRSRRLGRDRSWRLLARWPARPGVRSWRTRR